MIVLLVVGFLAGLVTGISPYILPVLPVIFASGAASGLDDPTGPPRPAGGGPRPEPVREPAPVGAALGSPLAPAPAPVSGPACVSGPAGDPVATAAPPADTQRDLAALHRRRRPFAVVVGLVLSFSAATLVGTWVLGALGLPSDLLRWLGVGVLALLGTGLVVPRIGDLLERPFARLSTGRPLTEGGGFVLGLSLGLVFVPCAGPVLAAVTFVGNTHHIGGGAVLLTAAFAAGVAVPLLCFALAGQYLASRMPAVRSRAALVRRVVGVVLLGTAVVLSLNLTDGIQRAVPGYTDALTEHLESNPSATRALDGVKGLQGGGALANCTDASPVLQSCGAAPEFTGISHWLDTLGGRPLTIAGLHGRVVLVDFWTYSCINCQRSLPHVEAWDAAYARAGLTVVGVHTPEFSFEHDVSNITRAASALGVHYPIAVDNDSATWNNYQNNYWPAEFLIDATGTVRHVDFGEGRYAQSETFIRQLLVAAHPTVSLPPRTDVPDTSPRVPLTRETYLGYHYLEPNLAAGSVHPDTTATYTPPAELPQDTFAFGGQWDVGSEGARAGTGATIELRYQAQDVYLVLGGRGTVSVAVDGRPVRTVAVGGEPTLYRLVGPGPYRQGLLTVSVPPGVEAYDFTFG